MTDPIKYPREEWVLWQGAYWKVIGLRATTRLIRKYGTNLTTRVTTFQLDVDNG